MFKNEFQNVVNASKAKLAFLEKNPLGYLLSSGLAGIYVGIGIILIFTVGGLLSGLPYAKILMGISFGIALSLVIMAGSELFTGNNLVMTAGSLSKEVPWAKTVKVWIVCYIGNWLGSAILAVLYNFSGLNKGPVAEFIASTTLAKTTAPISELFIRAMLCNILVCLAVWCSIKLQSEAGKLIMVFWCLFAFITSGFEHSVANMTLLTIGLLNPMDQAITVAGYLTNIIVVSLGNMAGAILFVALPYYVMQREKLVNNK
ncbi:MAG: formate/nitrite transporter family protein [Lachnospiraceae bacterium]